jgi:hypothetical protein
MKRTHDAGRLQELLADEALGRLDVTCGSELEALLRESPEAERDALMRTAALTQLAFLRRDPAALQPMPASLRARLLGTAEVQRSAIKPAEGLCRAILPHDSTGPGIGQQVSCAG